MRAVVKVQAWESCALGRRAQRQVGRRSGRGHLAEWLVLLRIVIRLRNRDWRWCVSPRPCSTLIKRVGSARRAREAFGRAERASSPALSLLLLAFLSHLEVVVQYRRNDGHHIGLDDSRAHCFRASYANIHDALERQVPFPLLHHVLAPSLFENTYQPLDAAIDGEYIAYAPGGGGKVCEVVERVYEGEGGGAVKRSAIVEGGGDADGGFVRVRDAEVDLSHVCASPSRRAECAVAACLMTRGANSVMTGC